MNVFVSTLGVLVVGMATCAETHLDIAAPDLMDTDLKGPVHIVDMKVTYNVSGKFDRERWEYDEVGNLLNNAEWNPDGELINVLTNTYDEAGNFVSQLYIDIEDEFTNDWEVILSPDTSQIAMRKLSSGAASLYTYNEDGYLLNYKYMNKQKKRLSASTTKRDELNRSIEYTKIDRDGKPLYTYWSRWNDDGTIDRERQKYRQEKGERLHVYDYLKTDEFGNWTQRLKVRYDIGGKEKEKVWERLVIRDIEYHFNDRSIADNEEPDDIDAATTNLTLSLADESADDSTNVVASVTDESEEIEDTPTPEKSKKWKSEVAPKPIAELLATGRTQTELKEVFDYTFDEIADKLVIITCKSERGRSSGSGFVAKMNGKSYLFTNQHVIMGADTIRLKTAEGETIVPTGSVELSQKRDIARIAVDEERTSFDLANTFPMGSPLGVFGNSEGAGVATELFGEVTGLGKDVVEVNADFVSGNSGSPVLDVNQNVIGIASYVRVVWEPPKNEDKEDTDDSEEDEEVELESKTRRFCYRLDDLKWQSVKWKTYNNKYGKLYRDSEAISQDVFDIINIWSDSIADKLPEKDNMASDLAKWVDKHNDIIERMERGQYRGNKSGLLNAYSQSLEILSKTCHDRSRRIKMFSKQRELSGWLQEEFEKNAYSLEYAGHYIQAVADDIAND